MSPRTAFHMPGPLNLAVPPALQQTLLPEPLLKPIAKSSKLASVSYDIRGPVLDKARQMEEEGQKIIKLNIGNTAVFGLTLIVLGFQTFAFTLLLHIIGRRHVRGPS